MISVMPQIVQNQLNFDNSQSSKTTVTFLNRLNIKLVILKNGFHCTAPKLSAGLQVTEATMCPLRCLLCVGKQVSHTINSSNIIHIDATKFSNPSQKGLSRAFLFLFLNGK